MTGPCVQRQGWRCGSVGRLDRKAPGVAGWCYLYHDLVTTRLWGEQGRRCSGPRARGCRPARRAGWRYFYQDLVTRSVYAWPVGPALKFLASACSAGWHGSNAMADRHATTARRVVATRRNARHAVVPRSCPNRTPRRRCTSMCAACAAERTPSPVSGVGRWSHWSNIRVRHRGIAARPAVPRPRVREQRSGCAGCGSDGSKRQTLRGLRYRNSTPRPVAPCWWGVLGEMLMAHAPRQSRPPLRLQVTFEATRLAAEQLATAYDHLLPGRRQLRQPPTVATPPSAPDEQTPRAQEGA
jgi:hypothetical protein